MGSIALQCPRRTHQGVLPWYRKVLPARGEHPIREFDRSDCAIGGAGLLQRPSSALLFELAQTPEGCVVPQLARARADGPTRSPSFTANKAESVMCSLFRQSVTFDTMAVPPRKAELITKFVS